MTTQAELLSIAEKHKDDRAVSILVSAINASQSSANASLEMLQLSVNLMRNGVNLKEGYGVPLDGSDMAKEAAKASAAISVMANHLFNLAALLQAMGENIEY